jgi:cytochrome c oxidase cbb3-type subunit 3
MSPSRVSAAGAVLAGTILAAGALAQPSQRAQTTHAFLGLGVVPDREAAARGAPLFQQNCSFCHGAQGRGAEGPSLITSDQVLADDHGEKLVPFLKAGRPQKGMPAFARMPEASLKDIAEFLHLQVENVANRGTYRILNIVQGDPVKGRAYVAANCMSCHSEASFAHIRARFRSPELLQRGWVWPDRPADHSLDVTATVRMPDGNTLSGRVTQVSDFKITLLDQAGTPQTIARGAGVKVELKDPLAPHQALLMTLKNDDMRNVTAYLDSLK